MISETVTIEVAENSTYKNGHAVVTAKFQMRNLGDTAEEMTVRFPLSLSHYYIHLSIDGCKYEGYPTIDDISVWVDDRQLEVTKTFKQSLVHM